MKRRYDINLGSIGINEIPDIEDLGKTVFGVHNLKIDEENKKLLVDFNPGVSDIYIMSELRSVYKKSFPEIEIW